MNNLIPMPRHMADGYGAIAESPIYLNIDFIVAIYTEPNALNDVIVSMHGDPDEGFVFPNYPGGVAGFTRDLIAKHREGD